VWFAGAVIGHDLILMPLYALADKSVMTVFRHRPPKLPTVPWINYLRVPVVLSGLLLLIWFPLIFKIPSHFPRYTDLSLDPYLGHWLVVTGALFLLSAVAFAFRLRPGRTQPAPDWADPQPGRPDAYDDPPGPPQHLLDAQDWRDWENPPPGQDRPPAPGRHRQGPGDSRQRQGGGRPYPGGQSSGGRYPGGQYPGDQWPGDGREWTGNGRQRPGNQWQEDDRQWRGDIRQRPGTGPQRAADGRQRPGERWPEDQRPPEDQWREDDRYWPGDSRQRPREQWLEGDRQWPGDGREWPGDDRQWPSGG